MKAKTRADALAVPHVVQPLREEQRESSGTPLFVPLRNVEFWSSFWTAVPAWLRGFGRNRGSCPTGARHADDLCRPGVREGHQGCISEERMLGFLRELGYDFCTVLLKSDRTCDQGDCGRNRHGKRRTTDAPEGDSQSIKGLRSGLCHPERPRYALRQKVRWRRDGGKGYPTRARP